MIQSEYTQKAIRRCLELGYTNKELLSLLPFSSTSEKRADRVLGLTLALLSDEFTTNKEYAERYDCNIATVGKDMAKIGHRATYLIQLKSYQEYSKFVKECDRLV